MMVQEHIIYVCAWDFYDCSIFLANCAHIIKYKLKVAMTRLKTESL